MFWDHLFPFRFLGERFFNQIILYTLILRRVIFDEYLPQMTFMHRIQVRPKRSMCAKNARGRLESVIFLRYFNFVAKIRRAHG